MAPPAPLACGFSECDWTTPLNVPTWELVIRVMDQHILAAHGVTGQQGQGQGGGSRQERLPRPTLDTGITEADWTYSSLSGIATKGPPGWRVRTPLTSSGPAPLTSSPDRPTTLEPTRTPVRLT